MRRSLKKLVVLVLGLGGVAFAIEGVRRSSRPAALPAVTPVQSHPLAAADRLVIQEASRGLTLAGSLSPQNQAISALLELQQMAVSARANSSGNARIQSSNEARMRALRSQLKKACAQLPAGSALAGQACLAAANQDTQLQWKDPAGQGLRIDLPAASGSASDGSVTPATQSKLSLFGGLAAQLQVSTDTATCQAPLTLKKPRDPAPSLAATDLLTERTPAIVQAAQKLGTPTQAFFFVRDQIRFLPRFGAAQSASQVLRSEAGTAADKSSLLIALLRAQGVAAQYLAGDVFVPESRLKTLFGVAGSFDLYWALKLTLGGEPQPLDLAGVRVWRLPHVWVHAYISGRWRQLDPVGADRDLGSVDLAASSPSFGDDPVAAYLFDPDSALRWVKPGTLVDTLVDRAGDLSQVGLSDFGIRVDQRQIDLPLGVIGGGDPCLQAQADTLPESYQFKSTILAGPADAPLLQVALPLAQARGAPLWLQSSGSGSLVLSSGDTSLATSARSLEPSETFDLTHSIQEPAAYGGRVELRTTPGLQAGGVQVVSHAVAPVVEADRNDEIHAIRALQAAGAPQGAIAARLLRYAAISSLLRSGETDRDVARLRGVSQWSESLVITQSLSGQVTDDQNLDLGMVPAGASMDWVISGPVYSRSGDHELIGDYSALAQARGETVVAGSSIEGEVWGDLFGSREGISAVLVLQQASALNATLQAGVSPVNLQTGQAIAPVELVRGESLGASHSADLLGRLSGGMLQQVPLLQSLASEAPLLYSAAGTITLESGWSGEAMLIWPTQALGRAASYLSLPSGALWYGAWVQSGLGGAFIGCCYKDSGCHQNYPFGYVCEDIPGQLGGAQMGDDGQAFRDVFDFLVAYHPGEDGFYYYHREYYDPSAPGNDPNPFPPISDFPPETPLSSGSVGGNGTPNTSANPGQTACGNPVNIASGAMWHAMTDFSVPGRTEATTLHWQRTYLAFPATAESGDFGRNWSHNWETRLISQASGLSMGPDLIWIDEYGGAWRFARQGDGSLKAPPGTFVTLTEASDRYQLRHKNGVVYTFSRNGLVPNGRLMSVSEPHGQAVTLNYDASGKLVSLSEPRAGVVSLTRDALGRIVQVVRVRDGLSYTYTYNVDGRLESSADFDGNTTHYSYVSDRPGKKAQGLLSGITDPLGRTLGFTYYDNGRAYEQTEPGGAYRAFMYSIDGAVNRYTRMLDLDGRAIQFNFDDQERVVERVYPDGARARQVWDAAGNVVSRTDELGNTTTYTFDSLGNVTGVKKPLDSGPTSIAYDPAFSKPTLITPLAGSPIQLTVDPATGDVTQIQRSDAQGPLSLVLGHDNLGNVLSTNNGLGTYANATDANGLYTSLFDARNPETRAYDSRGRLATRTWNATGRQMSYTWDNHDRLLRVDDTAGPSFVVTYDVVGRRTSQSVVPRDGGTPETTTFVWDDRDRLISSTDALGRVSRIEYDTESVRCEVKDLPARVIDPAGRVTKLEYDLRQRLVRQTDANGGIIRYNYNARGDLTELTDASGNSTFFAWDANGRKVQQLRASLVSDPQTGASRAATEVTNFSWDAAGKLLREEKVSAADSHTVFATTLIYDSLDHLVEKKVTKEVNGAVVELQDDSTYAYSRQLDAELRTAANNGVEQLSFSHEALPPYASLGYSVQATDAANKLGLIQDTYQLTPDVTGEIAAITSSSGKTVWSAQYDPAGRLTRIASGDYIPGQSLTSTITFDSFLRKRGVVHSTGLVGSFSYDALDRITSISWNGLDGTGASQAFLERPTYDALTGNIASIEREFGTFSYGYDALDQLTSSQYSGTMTLPLGLVNRTWKYDWTGNRLRDSHGGVGQFIANFEIGNNQNTYVADPDGLGELSKILSNNDKSLEAFGYRADGRMTSYLKQVDTNSNGVDPNDPIIVQASYAYDALGRRVGKSIVLTPRGGPTKKHPVQAFTQSYGYLVDQDKILLSKNGVGQVAEYLDGRGIDEHFGEVSSVGIKAYVTDHLSSVINSPAAGGVSAFGVYGENLGTKVSLNASSLPLMRGFAGMSLDAASGLYETPFRELESQTGRWLSKDPIWPRGGINAYTYVLNNPLKYVDPIGLDYTVPTQGGTFVYPGSPGQGVGGPVNFIPTSTMEGVDTPVQSGVASLGPIGVFAIGATYFTGGGPVVSAIVGFFEGAFGPDVTSLPAQFMNIVNTMGQTAFPGDPAFQPKPSPSCSK